MPPSAYPVTAGVPDAAAKGRALAQHFPINNSVWIGAGAHLLPRVTKRLGSVISPAVFVTRRVPQGVVVAGNPARVLRPITDQEQEACQ